RGDVWSGAGGAGLEQYRMALRRARDVERTAHREMLAPVVQDMDFRRVEIAAGGAVAQKRVVVPAVPQPLHDLDELHRAVITLAVGEMLLAAEIPRLVDRR